MTPLEDPARLAAAFTFVVRLCGVPVPVGAVSVYGLALAAVDLLDESAVYWAGRATLVCRPDDITCYDEAFARFWRGVPPGSVRRVAPVEVEMPATPTEGQRYSAAEVLRQKDFARYSASDFEEAKRISSLLRTKPIVQRSRRQRPGRGTDPDLRRTLRRAMRTGGEAAVLARRGPGQRARRLVLICDVSGSMEPYSRALLRFAHTVVTTNERVDVFALGTRLTRLTPKLRTRDPDSALAACAATVADWSGGTRLGAALTEFNDEWGIRGFARGAVVVILSDGWDRGDPSVVSTQMARLHRVAYKVVWVNPLKASPGYEPLARGMAAALPWVDAFFDGHSLAALEDLVRVIGM